MNVDNTSNYGRNTAGLSSLNETAFTRMVACGHRVVSIDKFTNNKFRVNTECTSGVGHGSNICQGFMHFSIKHKEVNLYLAHFDHTDRCVDESPFERDTVENAESNNTSLRAIIDGAKAIANSEIKKENDKLSRIHSRKTGYVPATPYGLMRANKIFESVEKLESLFVLSETSSSD